MAKQPVKKKPAKDHQEIARSVLNAVVRDAQPAEKSEKNPEAVALGPRHTSRSPRRSMSSSKPAAARSV